MEARVIDVRGSGPPLVYVPGIDGSGELLLGTAARLAASFRLVRLRYAGDPGGGYEELAASLVRVLDELEIERALLLAESFGVSVALETALDHPQRVAGLALVNGFAYFERRLRLALTRASAVLVSRNLYRGGRARFAQSYLFGPRRDEQALRALLALPADWFDVGYRARLALIRRVDLRERLREIRQPVAIFASDRDRIVAALSAGRAMAERMSAVELTVLERAGHVVLPLADEPWVERLLHLAERAGMR